MMPTAITSDQHEQLRRFVEDAVHKALDELGIDSLGAQRVIKRGDEFTSAILTAVFSPLKNLSVPDKFEGEEVKSNSCYPSGYKPRGIAEQVKHLRELFPGIGTACEKLVSTENTARILPPNAEGWFAIPRWEKIAATYNEAVKIVLGSILKTNGNFSDGQFSPERLRQEVETLRAWEMIGAEQKDCDILIFPAQFGQLHRGRSACQAREALASGEFCLGVFAVGIMILTHPERLMHCDDLWIDCSGDAYNNPGSDNRFSHVPYFGRYRAELSLDTGWFGNVYDFCGSASGFVPQK
jgi:hypothetical protein